MGRSVALSLYLMFAGRGAVPAPGRPERLPGDLLWIHAGEGSSAESVGQLLRLIQRAAPHLQVLLTAADGDRSAGSFRVTGPQRDLVPAETFADVRGFLDHWAPDAALFVGSSLPPVLVVETARRNVPMVLADSTLDHRGLSLWRRSITGSLLGRFSRILAQDPETVTTMVRLGGRALPVELGGRIEETTEPLPCLEAEREVIAELLAGRPAWMAVSCPEGEEDAVISAHVHAMQHAHRLLLILSPADAARTGALIQKLSDAGLIVASRADEGYPDPDVQVLLTDGASELGLWYRLAPVTYMGGTLLPGGAGRNPAEPAALGSAIVHGPSAGAYPDAYSRLTEARATRPVASAEGLTIAIADLIAPDKAAILAHNAWAATSGGAEVAERVVQATLDALANRPGRKAAA